MKNTTNEMIADAPKTTKAKAVTKQKKEAADEEMQVDEVL